ncbi:hypothetical protein JRO89_XSUnG0140800 [Xanthoceras sorbifolium]|uniref:CAP-Gly domain-containing linker protein 1 n=1 Tax=Xanthoceras sorbifolium TaxID=99658 RepID=A0ABQ8GZC2_9ROSI|nr:hypothetical protein JRO89_XSUnG0140800 [Xanthoceras sorbifolium]
MKKKTDVDSTRLVAKNGEVGEFCGGYVDEFVECHSLQMANSDSTPSVPVSAPLAPELTESRTELLNRIQGLKQDLQSWRSKLDTQVKIYRDELSEMKKSLNVEVDQLRSEFQELRSTLQQQQDDVTASLKNLGLQDVTGDAKEVQDPKTDGKDGEGHASPQDDNAKEDEN